MSACFKAGGARRRFVLATALGCLGFISFVRCAFAQAKQVKVGILAPLARTAYGSMLIERLGEVGYRNGSTMSLEYRSADGYPERYSKLASELGSLNCDVIFAIGPENTAIALRDAGVPAPVVFLSTDYDPVEKGLVASLSRPGKNMTGVFMPQPLLAAKRLELAREALPGTTQYLVLADPYSREQVASLRSAAQSHGVRLHVVNLAKQPYDYTAAFEAGRRAGVQALLGTSSPVFGRDRAKLAELIRTYRIPAVVPAYMTSEPGILVSYSSNVAKASRRAADIGVRILKGARPADIPVEQADEFELIINLGTAKALNLKLPYSILARATRLIE
jgi:putative tryptophan/tyrosine transport system substrate-binding protein